MLGVKDTRDLRAMAQVFKDADKETQKRIRKASQQAAPWLRDAAMRRAHDEVSRKIAATGKVAPTAKGLKATFGASGRHGSAKLSELARPWEFGGAQQRFDTYRRNGYKVRRRTQKQIPSKAPNGRFIYPAVADVAPRIVGVWLRACVEAVTDG